MEYDPDNFFDCDDSPLDFGSSLEMDQPWYHEFERHFVARHIRFKNWNSILANTQLHFVYKQHTTRSTDFDLHIISPDHKAANMVFSYLNTVSELTITKPPQSQTASLDNNSHTLHFHVLSAQCHTLMPRSFEMFMRIRFRNSNLTFES